VDSISPQTQEIIIIITIMCKVALVLLFLNYRKLLKTGGGDGKFL
jgi:hypothetical protein